VGRGGTGGKSRKRVKTGMEKREAMRACGIEVGTCSDRHGWVPTQIEEQRCHRAHTQLRCIKPLKRGKMIRVTRWIAGACSDLQV
jgi:hypothetical protein